MKEKDQSFYMALPKTDREKIRERQKLKSYREFTRKLTSLDADTQMEAETEYLIEENHILYERLTEGDTKLLEISPDNFRILGRLAQRLSTRYRKDLVIMPFEELMRGFEHFLVNPPNIKTNQIPLDIEQLIVDMALENPTWGTPHILHSMRNLGYFCLKEYHVRTALKKNHIPIIKERMKKGLSWKNFAAVLKQNEGDGVIYI